jgi:hypothetical protein
MNAPAEMNGRAPLRALIEVTADDVERALAEQAKDETAVALVQPQLAGLAASVGAEELNRALEADAVELMVPAWKQVQAVRDAARRTAGRAERTVVTLGPHDVLARHHPVLVLSMSQIVLPELRLTVELMARFKSLGLAIADAALLSVAPGEASVTARLKYREVLLKEQTYPLWSLPAQLSFSPAVPVLL